MTKISFVRKIFSSKDDTKSIKTLIIKSICLYVVVFKKPDHWYNAALKIYKLTKYLKIISVNKIFHFEIVRLRILDQVLSLLTRSKVPFHIPYNFNSPEIKKENGILYCATHLPLMKVCLKAMIENHYPFDAAIAWNTSSDNKIAIWGMKEKHAAIKASDVNVLLKTKTLLLNSGSVFLMLDDHENKGYSSNGLKLCQITRSKITFCFAKLNRNGMISTWIEPAPFPYCNTDAEIEENIAYLKQKTNQIFDEYQNRT